MSVIYWRDSMQRMMQRRRRIEYPQNASRVVMKLQTQNMLNEIEILHLTEQSVIHEHQEIVASSVISAFKDRTVINVMVLAKTQSGKTGSMCATIKQYLEDSNNILPIENIYIITGLSSCEWKQQTKKRMPKSIQERVFHRCELPTTFATEIKNKENVLIIMDEIQVAAKQGQTIYNSFRLAGLLDKQTLYNNDVKILEFTATPDGTIYDLMKWNEASCKILAPVGDGYTSAFDLLQQGRVKQFKELYANKEALVELKADVDAFHKPLYHIIRTGCKGTMHKDTVQSFKNCFGDDANYIKHDGDSNTNVNDILQIAPHKHTFIFIKEMLRCAKTLDKSFVGILYDRYTENPDDATINQGLIGRNTGYDDNGFSICYTNIDSIEKYEQLWNSQFEDKTVNWTSKTTQYKNGLLSGKNTYNDPKFYVKGSESDDDDEPQIHKFKTQMEAKEYYNATLKTSFGGRGPNMRKPNEHGFYTATIGKGVNRIQVRSTNEIYNIRKWALNETHHYTFYPCYEDVNDQSTLQWWFIHY